MAGVDRAARALDGLRGVDAEAAEVAVDREALPKLVADRQSLISRAQQDLVRAERAGAEEEHRRRDGLLIAVVGPMVAVGDGVAGARLREVADLRERP